MLIIYTIVQLVIGHSISKMNRSLPTPTLTLEVKSLLAYALIPILIVFPASMYVAYYGINDGLKTLSLIHI